MTRVPVAGPRGGGSPAALILFIILTVAFGLLTYVLYTDREKMNSNLTKATSDLQSSKQDLDARTKELKHLYADVLDYPSEEVIREAVPEGQTLKAFMNSLRDRLTQLGSEKESLKSQLNAAIVARNQAVDAQRVTDETRDRQVKDLRQELDKLQSEFKEMQDRYEDQIGQAAEAKADAEKTLRVKLEEYDEDRRSLMSQLLILHQQLEDLRAKMLGPGEEALAPVVGKVLKVDHEGRFAVVDLGQSDRIKRGMAFEVYRKDVQTQKKARLIVRDVEPRTSYTKIVDEDQTHPVIEGDFLRSFAYGRKDIRPQFVLVGKFLETASYTRPELEKIIKDWGGEVVPDVKMGVNYVVAGEVTERLDDPENVKAREQIADAKSLGISIMSLDRFLEYIRTD